MRKSRIETQSGYSLIEVLIVLVVVGVIVTFAVMALGKSKDSIDRQTIAKEFKVALERSRFDSIKRRPANCSDMARVEILSQTSFRYITDQDQDGKLTPSVETRTVDFASRATTKIVEDPLPTFPVIIRFNQRGETSSGPCGAEVVAHTPTVFCQMPCTTVNEQNATAVYISPSGTVALLKGGESLPTFTPPTESDVPTDSLINQFLAVWTGTPPTPTPLPTPGGPSGTPSETVTPTPTPTPTPSGTVTPTPTPSPSPSGSVTPTPTPPLAACAKNAIPGTPPTCDCDGGRHVQSNGMCK